MELSRNTVQTVIKSLTIAKAKVEADYSSNHLQGTIDPRVGRKQLPVQTDLIDMIDEFDKALSDFRTLEYRMKSREEQA